MGYSYEIVYKKGCDNKAANALSRVHGLGLLTMGLSTIQPLMLERLQQGWQSDRVLQGLIKPSNMLLGMVNY